MKFGVAAAFLPLLLLHRCCCTTTTTTTERKVCLGTHNQFSMVGGKENHYENMVRMYSNCSVVLENLEVTHTLENHDLSFLQSIQEVGGYVLIALNHGSLVPLVNLRLIRGQNLYEGQFALLVLSNYYRNQSSPTHDYSGGLRQVQLSSLTEILRGGVKISHNPLLCNMDSIQWLDIMDKDSNYSLIINKDNFTHTCDRCDQTCMNNSCWAPGPEHCQMYTKLLCADQCSRRCRGPRPSDCCNAHCAAGCTGPLATDCLACRDFNDGGTCKDTCPPLTLYDRKTHQVVSNPNAKFTYGATCVKACPHNYVVTGGSCVRACGGGFHEVEENGIHRCKECDGPCPKACDGLGVGTMVNTIAINASNIESFRNCTKINGDVSIIEISFKGDAHYKIPPMDPDKLDYFKTVKEITGFLLIQSWPANRTFLSGFENLQIIRGRTTHFHYSLVVVNAGHLRWLGLRSLREVSAGKVLIKNNPQLCYMQQRQQTWPHLFRSSSQEVKMANNGPSEVCELQNRTCDPECTELGCWGPGSSLCVSCRHFSRRGRCVATCNLLQGEPREAELNGSCLECHQECQVLESSPTCSGPGSDQCSQCAYYQDGPHCVTRCPHGVLGDGGTLIWKFPNGTGQCQPCHQNCTQGCSGPGLSGCSGSSSHSLAAMAVVGALLAAVVASLVVFVLLRRRRIKRKRTLRRILQERELVEPLTPSGESPNQALLRILKETELKKIRVLGSGAFGTVYKGVWTPEGETVRIPVAIKVLREATSQKANKEVLDEAYVMASVDHPHVCPLLGICLTSSVQLVTQLMPYGCLLDYVRHHRHAIGAQWLLNWCVQIAKGMSYLEERHLVHRDLAARNVLVKSPNHVKITDFGLSKLLTANETAYQADGGKVPIKWMALESILQWTYTHQSDVWSYGVTVWELMTFGSKPYDGIPASDISTILERGERLPQPPICTIDVYMIMVKCWMIDPSSRPTFRELTTEFSKLARDPSRYLVIKGDLPSPTDSRFFSRLLSSDDLGDVLDVDEYLRPDKELEEQHCRRQLQLARHTNGRPVRENSVALRYISDPTNNNQLERETYNHEYMNQEFKGSEVANGYYEDLNLSSGPSFLDKQASLSRGLNGGPEYLNTVNGDSLDNPNDQNTFLPQATSPSATTAPTGNNGLFLPAAENLEYLGLGAALHAPVR